MVLSITTVMLSAVMLSTVNCAGRGPPTRGRLFLLPYNNPKPACAGCRGLARVAIEVGRGVVSAVRDEHSADEHPSPGNMARHPPFRSRSDGRRLHPRRA